MKTQNLLISVGIFLLLVFLVQGVEAYNYEYVNVTARVNVTNAMPEILEMFVTDPVVLSAGSTRTVYCNATIRDWNGFNDIQSVNATFYYFQNESGPDHNDVHYTNASCVETGNDGGVIADYSCGFDVWYYARNGTWICNMSVLSSADLGTSNVSSTSVEALYALNVTSVIDYGNLTVTETSDDVVANVTNLGNTFVNVSVLGYGVVEGDGLGLVCDIGANITVENQRFFNSVVVWDDKIPLSSVDQDMGFTLDRPSQNTVPVISSTYWQLYVPPPNPFGVCTGTIRFTATLP